MSKSKPQQLTYTLAPLSARSHSHYNHHDQISSVTSTTQTRTAISPPQRSARPPRTHEPADDMIGQLSDLNTSGANTTICEYVKILTHNDYIQTEEPPKSLRSSTSEGRGAEAKVLKEVRMDRREGLDQMLELQKYRENGINYNRQSLAGKVLVTAPGHDDSATLVEFTDFVANTEPVVLDKENIPELKKERLNIGKIVIPPRMKANESKNCLQQSISKIAGGSAQHQNNISPSTSASITARKLREEHNTSHKGIETVPVSSRLMTSRTNDKDNYQTNPPSSVIKPLIQLTSPQIVTKKAKKSASAKSVLSHRNSHSSNLSSLQNPNKSLHKKFNPVPAPASRSVQAIVTPRGPYIIQNDENQKPLAPIKEEQGKTNERRANSKGDIKVKKDYKAMKATKIDLIEMDISRKYGQKRRDEKIEECSESLDIIYGMLRKAVSERKEGVSRNEQCMQKLEGLRDYMIETLSLVNNLKAE